MLPKRFFIYGLLAVALHLSSAGQSQDSNFLQEPTPAGQESKASRLLPTKKIANRTSPTAMRKEGEGVQNVEVVFMGDSITQFLAGGFFIGKNYVNRGISGQTTSQMLPRFCQDVISLRPKAVVILAGTNDIAGNTGPMTNEEIEQNLASMSELAKAAGIRVVLASITPVAASQTSQRPMSRILTINDWMRSYASANKQVYLDFFFAMIDSHGFMEPQLSDDGLHPNASGYAVMNPLAETAIATAVHRKR